MTKALQKMEDVSNEIDKIVKDCVPITSSLVPEFSKTLTLAQGVNTLREIFRTNKEIKETVQAMQNTPLGFMTDRTPAALRKAEENGKPKKPYSYDQISEACVEAMLNGYRITGNEFNVIAGRFYAAKAGKYRKIVEDPRVTDFKFAVAPPEIAGTTAKVRCFASWKIDGQPFSIGHNTGGNGVEDRVTFNVKVNSFMGDDAVIGKAQSKLFSRVLQYLTRRIQPEATDVTEADVIDVKPETKSADLNARLKESKPVQVPRQGEKPTDLKKHLQDLEAKGDKDLIEIMMKLQMPKVPSDADALEQLWSEYNKEAK